MSYILESDGEAVVIDPVYPVEYYLSKVSEIGRFEILEYIP